MENTNEKLEKFNKHVNEVHNQNHKDAENLGVRHGVSNMAAETVNGSLENIRGDYNGLKGELRSLTIESLEAYKQDHSSTKNQLSDVISKKKQNPGYRLERAKKIKERLVQDLQRLVDNHISAKRKIQNEFGFTMLENDYKVTEKKYEAHAKAIGRSNLDSILTTRWSMVWIFFLMFLEVPFTFSAFLVLKTLPIVSITISILVACMLALSAHFVGASVRIKRHYVVSILLSVFSLLVIQVTAHFRTMHANGERLTNQFFSQEDVFFLIIGITIYAICCAISYFAHDSDPEFQKVYGMYKKLKRMYSKTEVRMEVELSKEDKKLEEGKLDLEKRAEEELKQNEAIDAIELERLKQRLEAAVNAYNINLEKFKRMEAVIENLHRKSAVTYLSAVEAKRSVTLNGSVNKVQDLEKVLLNIKPLEL